jgi:Tol biopolymer transport system component
VRISITGWIGLAVLFLGLGIGFATDRVVIGANSNGGTEVGGLITSDTKWVADGSPYRVVSSVLIQSGVTLTIEPGVEIRFNPLLALQVNGGLIARGTPDAPIRFTSGAVTPAPGDWGFILFTDSSIDASYDESDDYMAGSILEHCAVEYAGSGTVVLIGSTVSPPPAIHVDRASPLINECAIRENRGSGIGVERGASKITKNDIRDNGPSSRGGGIYLHSVFAADHSAVSGNSIVDNAATESGGGIYVSNSVVTIEGNVISGNRVTGQCCGGGGILVSSWNRDVGIIGNVIEGNSAYGGGGIWLLNQNGGGIASITRNEIIGNTASHTGGGIFLSSSGGPTVVSFNTIEGNAANDHGSAVYVSGWRVDLFGNDIGGDLSPRSALWVLKSNSVNITGNNIYQTNTGYLLYNAIPNADPNLNAVNNWWGTAVEAEIGSRIYDWFEDLTVGFVDYVPYLLAPFSDPPPPPPPGLAAVGGAESGSIVLSWNASSEPDIAGYRVHYDTDAPGASYEGKGMIQGKSPIDVGNVTKFVFVGLETATTYYFSVSAYDVNENEGTLAGSVQTEPTPAPEPLVGRIAFTSKIDNDYEIYVMNADGSDQLLLTSGRSPSWSPTGERIAFQKGPRISVMNSDGTNQTILTGGPSDRDPTWSPDGSRIAFFRQAIGGFDGIYVINADGTDLRHIVSLPLDYSTFDVNGDEVGGRLMAEPDWAPDGLKIAFASSRDGSTDIYTVDVDDLRLTRLTDTQGSAREPDWSPDGSRIAFYSGRVVDGLNRQGIFVMDGDGENQHQLTSPQLGSHNNPAWSPDGSKITFDALNDGQVDIYVMDADGTKQLNLTKRQNLDYLPSWTRPKTLDLPPVPTPVPGPGLLGLVGLALGFLLIIGLRQRSIHSP